MRQRAPEPDSFLMRSNGVAAMATIMQRPQRTRENPFQQPGEEWDVANVQPYSDEIKFYPG
jgi:hypothetical protein